LSLINKYVFREALASTAMAIAVLLLIFMSNQFAETLADAAADALPRNAVLTVFGLQFVQYVSLLAPVGLLLGVLLAMARLNRDSEMTVLAACGVGPGRLLVPVGVLALLLASGVGWLSLIEAPAASRTIEEIRFQAQAELELGALTPGRFTALDGGSTVVYTSDADGDTSSGLFIEREFDGRTEVVLAREGQRVTNVDSGESMLRLLNGRRYEGTPGTPNFSISEFEEYGFPITSEEQEFEASIEARSTAQLLRSPDPESRAELAWRISAPVSILALALLAVPLGRTSPRENRYARFGAGLLIYIIYANTLSIARVWVERDLVPEWVSLWWVHAALALFALAMLARQSGIGTKRAQPLRERIEPVG
jgi:lipopolysaccharide export system permease protein